MLMAGTSVGESGTLGDIAVDEHASCNITKPDAQRICPSKDTHQTWVRRVELTR